ncbi:Sodium/solute symporter superfamily [Sesbania bispinosa]|nr:Sodium/solute symporter superfamily [Sesbania bispinosa]
MESGNKTLLCQDPHGHYHNSIWNSGNPLQSPSSLFFMQVSLITIATQFFDFCLRPLGQSSLVSYILGGVLFGPSILGHNKVLAHSLFPMRGALVLETIATFCLMFFYFICCMKMDPATMLKTEKQAITIGLSVFLFTLAIPTGLAFLLRQYVSMDKSLSEALPFIATSQSLTVFVSIVVLLTELKILNTDIGRLAMSASMFVDVISFPMTVLMFAIVQTVNIGGLVVPEGPPIGTTLQTKLETICEAFLYPIYLAVNGLQTDIFKVDIQSMWIVGLVIIVAFLVKIGAVMLPGYYFNVPMKDCCVIGLLLNGRGIAEITIYNTLKGSKQLSEQEFTLMMVSIVVVNAIITPLIKFLHDPSEQYHTGRRSSIQHTKRDSELRVMVCVYENENIPTILNILEASYASSESTVAVIALVLVELLGRARPILISHQPQDIVRSNSFNYSTQIDNALRQYAQVNEGYATVQSFTSISDFNTIHDDVCRIALDRRANILIIPFHKRWEIDGSVEVTNRGIQTMNLKVLERAPCSVAILIDRGVLSSSPSLLLARSMYYVAVFFIGGADDAEALAYGSRMARHECVSVSVVRFLLFGEENSKDRKRDSDLVDEYRYYNAGNRRFEIMDEVVKDGIEMSSRITKLRDYFDLVMVGREHPQSVLLHGHDQWSECPELGVIGDMLASQDLVTKASVLVVQQQRIGGRLVKHTMNPLPNQRDQMVHDVSFDEMSRASCTISVDKYERI